MYEPEVMEKVVALKKGKYKLEGNETPDLIETLFQEMMESKRSKPTEADVTPGIPNQLPPRTEVIQLGGKPRNFPVFFIAQVKGGEALYNERGQRMETAFSEEEKRSLHKKLAKINATRRANALPTDYAEIRQ